MIFKILHNLAKKFNVQPVRHTIQMPLYKYGVHTARHVSLSFESSYKTSSFQCLNKERERWAEIPD